MKRFIQIRFERGRFGRMGAMLELDHLSQKDLKRVDHKILAKIARYTQNLIEKTRMEDKTK